jgi:serine/threonine protein kinase
MAGQEPLIGGRYRLMEIIGQGGMGVVWRARDEILGRDVAIKEVVFPLRLSAEEQRLACARSLREARAAARLSHPAVITVHDVIEHDDRPWIVMELFRAGSLADLIGAGPLLPPRVAQIGLAVLEGLSAAHAAGVIHRDVKPSNVLVDGSRVVLTDFGAATIMDDPALTHTGLVIGTPAYLAPERARRAGTGPESDLWSLGATLYAAVEGHPPYSGEDSLAVLSALLTSDPEPHRQAGALGPVLDGLLQPDPARRITAAEAGAMLAEIGGSSRTPLASPHPPTVSAVPPGEQDSRGDGGPRGQDLAAITLTNPPISMPAPAEPGHTPISSSPPAGTTPPAAAPGAARRAPGRNWIRRPIVLAATGAAAVAVAVLVTLLLAAPARNAAAGSRLSSPPTSSRSAPASSRSTRPAATPSVQHTAPPPTRPYTAFRDPDHNTVFGVVFSPDSRTFATLGSGPAGGPGDTYLWNPVTGAHTATLGCPDGNMNNGAFNPGGSVLAAGASGGDTCLFDMSTGKRTAILSPGLTNVGGTTYLAYSPDGDTLASAFYLTAYLWNPVTGTRTATLHDPGSFNVAGVAFSPDGHILATADGNGNAYLWSTTTGTIAATLHDPDSSGLEGVAYSPDGHILATADANGSVYLWNTTTNTVTAALANKCGQYVTDIAFSPDGRILATSDYNGHAYPWNMTWLGT